MVSFQEMKTHRDHEQGEQRMIRMETFQSPENMSKEQLESLVCELMMECDERHAHEDALAEQIRKLGGIPVLSPSILAVYDEPILDNEER